MVVRYTSPQRKTSLPALIVAFTLILILTVFMTMKCLKWNSILLHHDCWGGRSYMLEIKLTPYARYSQISTKYRLLLAWYHCTMQSKTIISWSNHMTSLFIHHLSVGLGGHLLPEEYLCLYSCFPRCYGNFSYLYPIHQSHVTTCWKHTQQCWTNLPQSLLLSAGRQQQI